MSKVYKILLPALLVVFGLLAWLFMVSDPKRQHADRQAARARAPAVVQPAKKTASAEAVAVSVPERKGSPERKKAAEDVGWAKNPFREKPAFDFDEEINAQMSDELKDILTELALATSALRPNRKAAFAAARRLLALIDSPNGSSVPQFAKLQAVDALKGLGVDAAPELVALTGDADAMVSQAATDGLMEQLTDFDATEADLLTLVEQLVKLEMSESDYESIIFAVSSFGNQNKVKAALAIWDTGTDGALAALKTNADFVFDEAAAESIVSRADVVQYGKDHPESGTEFEIKVEK